MRVLKIFQHEQKWLINLGKELHTRNATLDTERSLKQIFIWIEKTLKYPLTLFSVCVCWGGGGELYPPP